ncbi:MAG: hypothetical protein ACR2FY_17620 [Pirellulaceae bacterium]
MVTFILCSAFVLAAPASSNSDSSKAKDTEAKPAKRLAAEIDRDISAALKREATAKILKERGKAIEQLCSLHYEITSDERFTTLDQMQSLRAKIWGRLVKVKADLKRQLAKDGQPQLDDAQAEAAQYASSNLAGAMGLSDFATGGPSNYFGRGGASQTDYNAQQLIELIQRTISPDFWDVVGGPGVIFYYPQLQVLVIRATSEIHDDIGGTVGALRE